MRVGIVGYGHLGEYLVRNISKDGAIYNIEISFVWNRSAAKLVGKIDEDLILTNLDDFALRKADLIVEVCHPEICKKYGKRFLQHSDLFIGSPTGFADNETEVALKSAADHYKHAIYVPSGALWGAADIKSMADRGTLQALKVTMKKHPRAFRLQGELSDLNDEVLQGNYSSLVLYDGPIRDLCPLAPNNVNTMAAAAIAGHNLGFDKVRGSLVSDSNLLEWHIVEVEVTGPGDVDEGKAFHTHTIRRNPAAIGAVTGNATYASFFSSLIPYMGMVAQSAWRGKNAKVHEIKGLGSTCVEMRGPREM